MGYLFLFDDFQRLSRIEFIHTDNAATRHDCPEPDLDIRGNMINGKVEQSPRIFFKIEFFNFHLDILHDAAVSMDDPLGFPVDPDVYKSSASSVSFTAEALCSRAAAKFSAAFRYKQKMILFRKRFADNQNFFQK